MDAVGRKSVRREGGSGSKKSRQHHRQNLPKAAISRQENRKRVFEEQRKERDDRAERERNPWSLSAEKVNALQAAGLWKEPTDGHEPPLWIFGGDIAELGRTYGPSLAEWQAVLNKPPKIREAKKKESVEEYERRMWAQLRGDQVEDVSDEDDEARRASHFRADWESLWSRRYGAFEDNTRIPAARFTSRKPPHDALHENGLQIFSVKVTTAKTGLPFDVFGMVAIRDTIDHNRNIIFRRTRDNCQTLTKEHPYLVLTGPTRAVMLELTAPVIIEVDLTLKGTTGSSEDEKLSSLAVPVLSSSRMFSHLWQCAYTSKLSTVEFTLGHIVSSVEATISVRITRGSWPAGLRGEFSAVATGVFAERPGPIYHTSVNDEEIVLLGSGVGRVPVAVDGDIELSRRVVSVDTSGELKVSVKALGGDNSRNEWVSFKPLDAGKGVGFIDMGFCAMDVTVLWSLISYHPVYAKSAL